MFKIDPEITEKDLKGKSIFKVLISMNSHQVATPETSLEEARSYVFIFHEGEHSLSAYIGLHLLLTDRKLFYVHSDNPFKEDKLSEVEDAARDFAEYLGAMLDEVDFANMSDLEQDKWIEEQGIFSTKKPPVAEPVAEPAAETATEPVTESVAETVTEPVAEMVTEPVKQAPVPEAAVATPAPQPIPAAVETISSPEPPARPVQPVPKHQPEEAKEQPHEVPVAKTATQDVLSQTLSPRTAAKQRKEPTSGSELPPKPILKKKSFSATSVVSRDREALARLLTSF